MANRAETLEQVVLEVDRREAERLIFREAVCTDENRYEEWLSLWTSECLYWVPSNSDDVDPRTHVNIIYDNRVAMEARIARLKTGAAWAQDPPSKMRRVIGNIEIEADGEDLVVWSNFILTELRRSKQDTFAGRTLHIMRREEGQLRIAMKKVLLVNNDEVIDNLTFII